MPLPNPEELSSVGKAVFEHIESKVQNPTINEWAGKVFGLHSTLTGESGEALAGYLKKFESNRDMHRAAATKALDEYHANPAAFDFKVQSGQYNTRYHKTISGMKGQVDPHILRGSANMQARNAMFGPHDEVMQGFIDDIRQEHGTKKNNMAAGDMKAKNVVDALGIYFHDTAYPGSKPGSAESRLASNLASKSSLVSDIDFMPSKYKSATDFERNIQQLTTAALAYKAGLKHVTTPLNALIGRTLSSAGKASMHLFGSGYDAARAEMLSINAMGQIFHEERQQLHDFNHGVIHQFAPGSIGEFVSKNWMIPGMSYMRQKTATFLAMQGKYAAMELAERLKLPDMKHVERARYDLKRLGIDPDKVKFNGYKLDNNDIRNAMFHNTNDRMHLDSGLYRASAASGTIMGRLIGQYHSYTAAQSTFLQQEILAAVAKGDPMLAVKNISMLATIFPMAGAAIGGLSAIWGGKHVAKALDQFKEDAGLKEGYRMAGLIQGFSDTAGFGIMEGYYRATMRYKLANQILGASAATGIEAIMDVGAAGKGFVMGSDKDKGPYQVKTWEPLARDLIHDVPSAGILPFLAGHFGWFETQQQLNEEKPRTAKQTMALEKSRAKRAAKKEANRRF